MNTVDTEMQNVGWCKPCKATKHERCLCEDCLMQAESYFDQDQVNNDTILRKHSRHQVKPELHHQIKNGPCTLHSASKKPKIMGDRTMDVDVEGATMVHSSICPFLNKLVTPKENENVSELYGTTIAGHDVEMFSMIPYVIDLSRKLVPGLWEKEKLKDVLSKFILTKETLEKVMTAMNEDFDNGLSCNPELNHKSPIKMLVTYVRSTPDGTEEGDFYALDLGGTNFRVLLVKIHNGQIEMIHKQYAMDDSLMKGTGQKLFGYIADCLAKFAGEHHMNRLCSVGFTFSFPIHQTSLTSGNLIKWTKGYSADGVEGRDIVQLLHGCIDEKDDFDVDKIALVNDTTGTMVACAFDDPDVEIGLILGTGTNACYMEKIENIPKWDGDMNSPKQVIINTEWGAFGEKGEIDFVKTEYDITVDKNSLYPGEQVYEKMISGMYLGEVARQVLLDLIKDKVIFNGCISSELEKQGSFETRFLSDIASDDAKKILDVLEHLGYKPTLKELQIVKDVCDMISMRSARLAAAGLATIIKRLEKNKLTIAIDGSLFKKHPKFKGYMEEALTELVPSCNVKLMLSEDGSGKGAALVAAVAARLNKKQ
eukprot:gene5743-6445_t